MRWFLLSLTLIVVVAQSQEPPPSPAKDRQRQETRSYNAKKNASLNQTGTEKLPLEVNVLTPEIVKLDAEKNRDKVEHKSFAERFVELGSITVTAIATIVMAIFTGCLWFSTEKLWKTTKESIDLARAEFIATHRPTLFVRRVSIKIARGIGIANDLGVEFIIANTGDTAAKITEMSARIWFPESTENLPPIPPYGESTYPGLTIESGESPPLTHYELAGLENRFHIRAGYVRAGGTDIGPDLLFLGYVDYEDGVKRQRRTAFLRRYNFATERFDPINHPDYEYQD